MKTIKFRDLKADELECRVGSTTEKGFTLLLYKTARVDANVLDESVAVFNWQKKFYQVKNTMICSIGINVNYDNEDKEPLWIWKDDAGDESNTEAIKGEASDSFKRAGFAWGIGRKLYNSPFIWVNKDDKNEPKKTRYSVKEIGYDETGVNKLTIVNAKTGEVVFTYGTGTKVATNVPKSLNSGSVSMKDISASVKSMEEHEIDNSYGGTNQYEEDKKVIKDYYDSLPQAKKEQFSGWLFNVVQETDIDKLSESKASRVATTIRKSKGE